VTAEKPPRKRKRPIEQYDHKGKKRVNNPPVGLVTPETDPLTPTRKEYDYLSPVPSVKPGKDLDYDPHLDPQLVWAGKNTPHSRCQRFRFTYMNGLTRARFNAGAALARLVGVSPEE
jgi:hypothetical protein